MAGFVQLILQEYPTKEEIPQTKACVGCLSQNVRFIDLSSCRHANVLEYILEFKIDLKHVICYTCHNILKKIESFRIQMIENLSALHNESKINTNKVKVKQTALGFSNIEIYSIYNYEVSLETQINKQSQQTETPTEIKDEYESSNSEHIPLEQIKKKKTSKTKTSNKNLSELQKLYKGKIKIIKLSKEEMLEERQVQMKQSNYLKLPFKCDLCYTAFEHEPTLQSHVETRHNKRTGKYECKICKSNLSTKMSYDEHMKRHFRRYECMECGKRTSNVYPLLKHYNDYHSKIEIQFTCKYCEFTTDKYRTLRYHLEKHRKGKSECKLCGKTFANEHGLRRHLLTLHAHTPPVYGCEKCDKVYRNKSGLTGHVRTAHGPSGSSGAYCTDCRTHFRNAQGLKHHLKTHSRHVSDCDKRFICNECGAKFLTNKSLQEHVDWVHLNDIKYECDACAKVFKTKTSLKKHLQNVHEKRRPPRNKICDHCGRAFTTLQILRSHIRTHTGERPHRCGACGATFAHTAALYTHNKLLHLNK